MDDNTFPKPVEDVISVLVALYRHQSEFDIAEVLDSASARIEETSYDNWNGGTRSYTLMLDIPVEVFASIEPRLDEIEKSIVKKLTNVCRNLSHDHLDGVSITPLTSKETSIGPKAKPAELAVKHLWMPGFFRLFLSHVSNHKEAIGKLKHELEVYGVSAFIAHADIEPISEWQDEIELGLRSMHALAALMTSDFHQSNWTDQEVGFALGRGVLVVPIRLGMDPYGFIGKTQGLSCPLEQPSRMANLIFSTLLNHPATHRHMRKGLAFAFEAANSYRTAIDLSRFVADVKDFAADEKAVIERACKNNDQVFNSTGVVTRVCNAIGVRNPHKVHAVEDVPF